MVAVICVLVTAGVSVEAAVVTGRTTSDGAFTVSSTDLLQTNLDSIDDSALDHTPAWGGGLPNLNDGSFVWGNSSCAFITEGTLIFNLDTNSVPDGYLVNQIDTFSGNSDRNRVMQQYTVSYATVDAPATFSDIATISSSNDGHTSEKWAITEGATGVLASNVCAIRFVFPLQEFSGGQYKEIDIIGEAIPLIWDGTASGDASWTNPDSNSWTGDTYTNGNYVAFLGAGTGTVSIAGTVTPGGITVDSSENYAISGTIAGTGALTKDGSGSLTVSGSTNDYTFSSITIDGGVMEVAGQKYTGTVNIDNGATYRHDTGGTYYFPTVNFGSKGGATVEVGAGNHLKLNSTVTATGGAENSISGGTWNAIGPAFGGGSTYTFSIADGSAASDLTVSTRCINWPHIDKTGDGTLTLTANNTQIAPFAISGGALLFNGSINPAPTNSPQYGDPVKVKGTTTLGGTGTIPYLVSVWGNGTLAAGDDNSIGALTLTNGLQFTASPPSTNIVRVTGVDAVQQNKVVVTGGAITLNSATLVIDDTGLSDMSSQPLTIVDNQTASAISGTFDGLAEGAEVSGINGSEWTISYVGGTGNDVVLTPPPRGMLMLIR